MQEGLCLKLRSHELYFWINYYSHFCFCGHRKNIKIKIGLPSTSFDNNLLKNIPCVTLALPVDFHLISLKPCKQQQEKEEDLTPSAWDDSSLIRWKWKAKVGNDWNFAGYHQKIKNAVILQHAWFQGHALHIAFKIWHSLILLVGGSDVEHLIPCGKMTSQLGKLNNGGRYLELHRFFFRLKLKMFCNV